jgi:hypothetical protein
MRCMVENATKRWLCWMASSLLWSSASCSGSDDMLSSPAMTQPPFAGVQAPPMGTPSAGSAGMSINVTPPPAANGGSGGQAATAGGAPATTMSTAGMGGGVASAPTIMTSDAGMTAAGAGGAAASDADAATGQCRPQFGSGLNVAWFKFAGDVPNPDLARFKQLYKDTHDAGGRIVRWWFHTNGTVTPGYDSEGKAKPLAPQDLADVRSILDAAHEAGVALVISLWSFDMLQGNQMAPLDQNIALLMKDDARQAYIDRVLTPLVTGLAGHPGLYAWEIFNEPEGMSNEHGWTNMNGGRTVEMSVIQTVVNWFADAIHKADSHALVANGAWQFAVNANVSSYQNMYSDAALTTVGGRAKGTLDFYEVHYYDNWNGSEVVSPFVHPRDYWQLDKPIQIGEFWAIDTNGVPAANLFTALFDGGYSGAWAWQYAADDGNGRTTKWPAMQVPLQNLYKAHAAAVDCTTGM